MFLKVPIIHNWSIKNLFCVESWINDEVKCNAWCSSMLAVKDMESFIFLGMLAACLCGWLQSVQSEISGQLLDGL